MLLGYHEMTHQRWWVFK